ncbi:MAG: hypothetical protein OIN85_01355 [Candidatus Methanoperedens sp.]|nr:hypothetical protein [Candidatus Methanoperedens sp.]
MSGFTRPGAPLERRTVASRTQADAGLFRTGGARLGTYRILEMGYKA